MLIQESREFQPEHQIQSLVRAIRQLLPPGAHDFHQSPFRASLFAPHLVVLWCSCVISSSHCHLDFEHYLLTNFHWSVIDLTPLKTSSHPVLFCDCIVLIFIRLCFIFDQQWLSLILNIARLLPPPLLIWAPPQINTLLCLLELLCSFQFEGFTIDEVDMRNMNDWMIWMFLISRNSSDWSVILILYPEYFVGHLGESVQGLQPCSRLRYSNSFFICAIWLYPWAIHSFIHYSCCFLSTHQ